MICNGISGFATRELALEPLDGEQASSPITGPAKFHPNTRDGGDRRCGRERREGIRLQPDRRKQRDRRPRRTWENGKNL